jgi:D-serine deaminase-like pyridoxal phosphate-dependent protein
VSDRWARYKRALAGEPLPAAIVDLDAFDANLARLVAPIRAAGKRVRLATKSIRCPALVERAGADALMTYTAAETAFHAARGVRDLVLAYPTVQAVDAAHLARANHTATAAAMVDDEAQLAPLVAAARAAGTTIPIVIDVDASWRPLEDAARRLAGRTVAAGAVHLGVRRSPLRDAAEVVALARRIAPPLRFHGIMSYEAQLAGLPDLGRRWQRPIVRAIKRGSEPAVVARRAGVVRALAEAGLPCVVVNGGGTGSVDWSSGDAALTEVTFGSGLLCGHLFDGYRGLALEPALAFGLQVTRRPAPGVVTCLGGGWIASGAAGPDRLPVPAWPHGCELIATEGAGEVQTPIRVTADVAIGDPVFFRPAKSGELAEHVATYLLVRGDRIVERVPTYRGLGHAFL